MHTTSQHHRSDTPIPGSSCFTEPPSLLVQLRTASKDLPVSVPYGTIDDDLARFAGDPAGEVADIDVDEQWEYINKSMD